jgi:hypothetical protein
MIGTQSRPPATLTFNVSEPIELTPGAAAVLLRILRNAHARQVDRPHDPTVVAPAANERRVA